MHTREVERGHAPVGRVWWAFLAAALGTTVFCLLLAGTPQVVVHQTLAFGTGVAMLVGVRLLRPGRTAGGTALHRVDGQRP